MFSIENYKMQKKFDNFKNEKFITIPDEDDIKIYYKVYSNKSIDRLNVALDKLELDSSDEDADKQDCLKNDVVYIFIENNFWGVDEYKPDESFLYGGEIDVYDWEVNAKKFGL